MYKVLVALVCVLVVGSVQAVDLFPSRSTAYVDMVEHMQDFGFGNCVTSGDLNADESVTRVVCDYVGAHRAPGLFFSSVPRTSTRGQLATLRNRLNAIGPRTFDCLVEIEADAVNVLGIDCVVR